MGVLVRWEHRPKGKQSHGKFEWALDQCIVRADWECAMQCIHTMQSYVFTWECPIHRFVRKIRCCVRRGYYGVSTATPPIVALHAAGYEFPGQLEPWMTTALTHYRQCERVAMQMCTLRLPGGKYLARHLAQHVFSFRYQVFYL